MTIKKRLFISNILMYVVPIVITMVMSAVLFFVFIGMTGDDSISPVHSTEDSIYKHVDTLSQEWTNDTDIKEIKADIVEKYLSTINRVRSKNLTTASIAFVFLVVIIFFTSRILTRVVFRSITGSIDTLAYGVHQIRDGNLNYRIEYNGKDEFSGICSEFNEMAHLSYPSCLCK